MNAVRSIVTGVLCLAAGVASADGTWRWTGAGEDALASNPANWADDAGAETVPTEGANVVFGVDGADKPCRWDLNVRLASWTQDGYSNTVTVETCYDGKGEFNVLYVGGGASRAARWRRPTTGRVAITITCRIVLART